MHKISPLSSAIKISLLVFFIGSNHYGFAQDNTNISITKKTDEYEFVKGNDVNPVLIEQKTTTVYKCNEFRTSIPCYYFYNDNISIDNLKILVNGSKKTGVTPKYGYYEDGDIFYTDARLCYFTLPLDKKEGESQVLIEKTFLDPRYFTNIFISDDYKIENGEISIIVPDWMDLSFKEYNFLGKNIQLTKTRDEKEKLPSISILSAISIRQKKKRILWGYLSVPTFVDLVEVCQPSR